MKILITGIAGLLGSKLAEYILNEKKEIVSQVIGIDDLSGGYLDNIPKHDKLEFFEISLLDYEDVERIYKKYKPDILFHFAAYAAEGLSPFIRKFNYNNNLLATTNLINMSIKYHTKRFVFTSSMASYGRGNNILPFTEETPQVPIDPYGIAKLACEMDLKVASEQHGLEYCIIRPHNVFGKNQNIWDKYRNVLGIWMYQILNNKPITIYGDGSQTRAFSYIDDMLEPLWKSGVDERAKNECINLGGKIEYTINEAANILQKITNYNNIVYKESRHEVKHAYSSYEKSEKLLDFEMKTSLEEGLIKMWEWAKQQPNRKQMIWQEYELEEGIYSFWKSK